ncbi:hypothetical protein M885DRAFT_539014 [Pelagophyceae sp. CCMP2097]|nr:hypothetical protein M885DRAFT_539014 [Pelagophyceae sp. CCMP2097]
MRVASLQLIGLGLIVAFASLSGMLVVLQLGWDDGYDKGMLAERKPSRADCLRSISRLQIASSMRGQIKISIEREGTGVIVLGPVVAGHKNTFDTIVRYAAQRSGLSVTAPACCERFGRAWDFSKRAQRRAVRGSTVWPLDVWTEASSYHPFLFAAVPRAQAQLVLVVSDPLDRLLREWASAARRMGGRARLRPVGDLLKFANATQKAPPAQRRRLLQRLFATPESSFSSDAMSQQLVGAGTRVGDACFEYVFQQRVQAVATGHWLAVVWGRLDESLVLLARAQRWRVDDVALRLPPPLGGGDEGQLDDELAQPDRALLEGLQPLDARLYSIANNALNSWIAKLGKGFANDLAQLRRARKTRGRECFNSTAAEICREPAQPPCVRYTVWGEWCGVSARLPFLTAR